MSAQRCGGLSGAEPTLTLIVREGRADDLGERSVGHPDFSAFSSGLLLQALTESAVEARGWRALADLDLADARSLARRCFRSEHLTAIRAICAAPSRS